MLPPLLRLRSVHLLLSLLALLLFHPFALLLPPPWDDGLGALLLTLVMLSALWWTTEGSGHRLLAVLLSTPGFAAIWVGEEQFGPVADLAWVLFMFYVTARLFGTILRSDVQIADRVFTAISVYLLLAITFANLHELVFKLEPAAYRFPEEASTGEDPGTMLYFSLVTMLTLGFGDIVPVNPFARMLTVFEAFVGAFFIAILIARLVSLPEEDERPRDVGAG